MILVMFRVLLPSWFTASSSTDRLRDDLPAIVWTVQGLLYQMVAAVWGVHSQSPCGQRVELSDTFWNVFVLSFGQSNLPLQQSNQTFQFHVWWNLWRGILPTRNTGRKHYEHFQAKIKQQTHLFLYLIKYSQIITLWYMICNSTGESKTLNFTF